MEVVTKVRIGWSLGAAFFLLSTLHIYWALGGRWGSEHAVPTLNGRKVLTPGPTACFVVAGLLDVAAIICVLSTTEIFNFFLFGKIAPLRGAMLGLSILFALRVVGDFRYVGLFKRVRGTGFALLDDRIYIPFCLSIAVWQ